jgi:hypothetical protein
MKTRSLICCLVPALVSCGGSFTEGPLETSPAGGSDVGGSAAGNGGQETTTTSSEGGSGGVGGSTTTTTTEEGGNGGQGGSEGGQGGVCVPGHQQCADLESQVCNQEGQWTTVTTCPFLCSDGECVGSCTPDDTQCNGDTPQTCSAQGEWIGSDVCPFTCVDGECAGYCHPGDKMCTNGINILECTPNAMSWQWIEVCQFVCADEVCTGVCTPNESRCNGTTIETCSALGQWVAGSACPFACAEGACNGVCTPNDVRCSGTGRQVCNAQSQWGVVTACPVEAHQNPTCSGNGVCGTTCQAGFDNCTAAPGCETDLSSPDSCGTCANNCNETNGTASCSNGTCSIECTNGFADCVGIVPGCETTLGSISNCEGCGDTCDSNLPNSTDICTATGCSFECDATWGDCNDDPSDGCEHDVWNDPFNCGACGNVCYGGTCSGGVCSQADLEMVAESPESIRGFTTDENNVYWVTTGTPAHFYVAPKDGSSAPVLIGSNPNMAQASIVTDGVNLAFWDGLATPVIRKINIATGVVTTLANGYGDLLLSDGYVYWNDYVTNDPWWGASYIPTHIYRVPLAGGATQLVVTVTYGTSQYMSIRNNLIHYNTHGVYRPSPDSFNNGGPSAAVKTSVNTVDNTSGSPNQIQYLGADRLFRNTSGMTTNSSYKFYNAYFGVGNGLLRYSFATGETTIISNQYTTARKFADGSHLYWSESSYIQQLSVNGGSPSTIVEGQRASQHLELDDDYIYWSTEGFRYPGPVEIITTHPAIMRVAK